MSRIAACPIRTGAIRCESSKASVGEYFMSSISSSRARLCLELLAQRCLLSHFGLGPTVQVSQDDPFANSTADDIQHQSGTLYPPTALETFMVVDPPTPDHIAG